MGLPSSFVFILILSLHSAASNKLDSILSVKVNCPNVGNKGYFLERMHTCSSFNASPAGSFNYDLLDDFRQVTQPPHTSASPTLTGGKSPISWGTQSESNVSVDK